MNNQIHSLKKLLLCASVLSGGFATSAAADSAVCADDPTNRALLALRRASLDLRGRLPNLAELESVANNGAIDPQILTNMVDDQAAIRFLRDHLRAALWINVTDNVMSPADFRLSPAGVGENMIYSVRFPTRQRNYRGGAATCRNVPAEFDAAGKIIAQQHPEFPAIFQEGYVEVEPYWAPGTTVKVCAFDAQTALTSTDTPRGQLQNCRDSSPRGCGCGPNLRFCQGPDTQRLILESANEQALRMIDRIVTAKRPFSELLLGTEVEINGPLAHYYREFANHAASRFLTASAKQDFPIPELGFHEVDRWERVSTTGRFSGILTQAAYLLKFASNRGRANRFYNAFLCQHFEPPAGGLQVASDPCHLEPNLTKRCGCNFCHLTLEPAAAHWGRYAEEGLVPMGAEDFPEFRPFCARPNARNNPACRRFYLTDPGHPDEEPFRGHLLSHVFADETRRANIETGPRGIANTAVESGAFARCTVQQLWERLMAREVNAGDAEALAQLSADFAASDDVVALLRALVARGEYVEAGAFGGDQ